MTVPLSNALETDGSFSPRIIRPLRFRLPFLTATPRLIDAAAEYASGIDYHRIPILDQRVILNASNGPANSKLLADKRTALPQGVRYVRSRFVFRSDVNSRSVHVALPTLIEGFDVYESGLRGETRQVDCAPADGFGITIDGPELEAHTTREGEEYEALDPQVALAIAFHALPRALGKS